ncbi:MAG TPA: hypothetical protein VFL84_04675 [Gammaproteobacteria bacterium]|nr:hypothetical protein [Gammaproteobacteria bacterium]
MSTGSASGEIEALFKLPLGEFTSARNALAAQLKKAGRAEEANAVKALAKPSASAWVVNQLYWRHRESFSRLLAAGEKLRRAHAAQLTGDAVNARREAMTELTKLAELIVMRDGTHSATRDLMRRVTSTLEALSSYASSPEAPIAGRLTDDLQPPGFEAVAGLLPQSGKARGQAKMRLPHAQPATNRASNVAAARRDEKGRKELVAAAKTAVRDAQRALNAARRQAERAAAKAEIAAKRAKQIEAQRAQIEKQLARASADAQAARAGASEATTAVNEATKSVESAERALELARQRLQQMLG